MSKKIYIGASSVAREVKKIYIGVGDIARKVTKGYIGVNGVAQQFYSAIELIDVGSSDLTEAGSWPNTYTLINKSNPANASGNITSIQIKSGSQVDGLIVATFELVGTNTFTARSRVVIGTVSSGVNTINVTLPVAAGDYIGYYCSGGMVQSNNVAGGVWYSTGDKTQCVNTMFSSDASDDALSISLYGTGST